MKKTTCIIDTDIGQDLDDMITIRYALMQPDLDVIGLICTYGDVPTRMAILTDLLDELGLDVPIYRGVSLPVVDNPEAHKDLFFADGSVRTDFEYHGLGVNLYLEAAEEYPDLVVFVIGPLSTLASAYQIAPEVMSQIELWFQGGVFTKQRGSFNINCDSSAANMVISSDINTTLVGWDVTQFNVLNDEQEDDLKSSEFGVRYLNKYIDMWQTTAKTTSITLHDPSVVWAYLNQSSCEFSEYQEVRVLTQGIEGLTYVPYVPIWQEKINAGSKSTRWITHYDSQEVISDVLKEM